MDNARSINKQGGRMVHVANTRGGRKPFEGVKSIKPSEQKA